MEPHHPDKFVDDMTLDASVIHRVIVTDYALDDTDKPSFQRRFYLTNTSNQYEFALQVRLPDTSFEPEGSLAYFARIGRFYYDAQEQLRLIAAKVDNLFCNRRYQWDTSQYRPFGPWEHRRPSGTVDHEVHAALTIPIPRGHDIRPRTPLGVPDASLPALAYTILYEADDKYTSPKITERDAIEARVLNTDAVERIAQSVRSAYERRMRDPTTTEEFRKYRLPFHSVRIPIRSNHDELPQEPPRTGQ